MTESVANLDTPVVLMMFNRPGVTAQAVEAIAQARPRRLLVICDGPRANRSDDQANVAACRALVDERVTWPCRIDRLYAEQNMGCGRRISSGLTEVFQRVDRAIIVEDDCIPAQPFFAFCHELLERYADDERVMHINGSNFQQRPWGGQESYRFSRYPLIWGWATWARAWRHYDFTMSSWPAFREAGLLRGVFHTADERRYWTGLFNDSIASRVDTWDYQWSYTVWEQGGLALTPRCNLVTNVGFDAQATHTQCDTPVARLPRGELTFPLRHPAFVVPDRDGDHETFIRSHRSWLLRATLGRASRWYRRLLGR